MDAFENAKTFFHNCESAKGWEACQEYVSENAEFHAQSEPLAEMTKVQEYVNWVEGLSNVTMPGCSYKLHAAAYDKENNTAIFYSTFTGTHKGEGGPTPPTGKTTNTHYVYALKMNDEGKVESMTKIWNSTWAMRELGWI
ncbi:ester cyclase [Limibacter armeniacum]|uniref:ester cyclase n=1 Tax=Limibacter armeniacum TaxID=466084 RepID=UPI002FE52C3B